MKTFEDLAIAVSLWAHEKGIIKPEQSQVNAQLLKVDEELAEYKEALATYYKSPVSDNLRQASLELGDLMVTIIVSSACAGLDPVYCLGLAYNKIKNRTGKVVNGIFVKETP